MSSETPTALASVAQHEAGHVVVARALGATSIEVRLREVGELWQGATRTHGVPPAGQVAVAVAGMLAEAPESLWPPAGYETDVTVIWEAARTELEQGQFKSPTVDDVRAVLDGGAAMAHELHPELVEYKDWIAVVSWGIALALRTLDERRAEVATVAADLEKNKAYDWSRS